MRKKKGNILIAIGLLFLAAALSLTGYNVWDDLRADHAAQTTVEALRTMIPGYGELQTEAVDNTVQTALSVSDGLAETDGSGVEPANSGNGQPSFEETEDQQSNFPAEAVLQSEPAPEGEEQKPDAVSEQDAADDADSANVESTDSAEDEESTEEFEAPDETVPEMPAVVVDYYRYIGVLEVDSIHLSLPVMEEWDYNRLRISPCRYSGSVYENNMVICGHNYAHHFSPLKYVPVGTDIKFTTSDGRVFRYTVDAVEILDPSAIDEMIYGDWDLTLFTCNGNGETRCAVRCIRTN